MSWWQTVLKVLGLAKPAVEDVLDEPSPAEVEKRHDAILDSQTDVARNKPSRPKPSDEG